MNKHTVPAFRLNLLWFLKQLAAILGFPSAEPLPLTVRR